MDIEKNLVVIEEHGPRNLLADHGRTLRDLHIAAMLNAAAPLSSSHGADPRDSQVRDPASFAAAIRSKTLDGAPAAKRLRDLRHSVLGLALDARRHTPSAVIKQITRHAPSGTAFDELVTAIGATRVLDAVRAS